MKQASYQPKMAWLIILSAMVITEMLAANVNFTRAPLDKRLHFSSRCGPFFPLENGLPSECDPDSDYPCCDPDGYCGNTKEQCECSSCLDYRKKQKGGKYRNDGWCGSSMNFTTSEKYAIYGECDAYSDKPCCSFGDYAHCGITEAHCGCYQCYDFRDLVQDKRCPFIRVDSSRRGRPKVHPKTKKEIEVEEFLNTSDTNLKKSIKAIYSVRTTPYTTKQGQNGRFQFTKYGTSCVDACFVRRHHTKSINAVWIDFDDYKEKRRRNFEACYCLELDISVNYLQRINGLACKMETTKRYVCNEESKKTIPRRRCGRPRVEEVVCTETLHCCYDKDGDDLTFPKCYHGYELEEITDKNERYEEGNIEQSSDSMTDVLAFLDSATEEANISIGDAHKWSEGWKEFEKKCSTDTECKKKYNEKSTATDLALTAVSLEGAKNLGGLFSKIMNGKTMKVVGKVIGMIGKFLGGLGPLFDFISLFQDSPEYQAIKHLTDVVERGFDQMERRFDQVIAAVDDLKKKIDFQFSDTKIKDQLMAISLFRINFAVYRNKSRLAPNDLRDLDVKAARNAISTVCLIFAGKLTGQGEFCKTAIPVSKGNKDELLKVQMSIFSAVVMGAATALQVTKLQQGLVLRKKKFKNNEKRFNRRKALLKKDFDTEVKRLENQLIQVHETIMECDRFVTEEYWKQQYKDDILEIMAPLANTPSIPGDISDAMYSKLKDKYWWRRWMVVVIEDKKTPNLSDDRKYRFETKDLLDYEHYYKKHGLYSVFVTNIMINAHFPPQFEPTAYTKWKLDNLQFARSFTMGTPLPPYFGDVSQYINYFKSLANKAFLIVLGEPKGSSSEGDEGFIEIIARNRNDIITHGDFQFTVYLLA